MYHQSSRGSDRGRGGYDNNSRGGYMRQPNRRGGYQSTSSMNGQSMNSGHSTPTYFGGQGSGPNQSYNSDKPFIPPQSRGNYKTELCKYFAQGSCPYQGKCSFAHGEPELKQKQIHSNGGQSNSYQGGSSQQQY